MKLDPKSPVRTVSKITKKKTRLQKAIEESPCINKLRANCNKIAEHRYVTTFMAIVTIYALFADDIRQQIDSISNPNVDTIIYSLMTASLCLFGIEIIIASIGKPDYFLGFFFWLDILATVSIIFDIGWISDAIFGTGGGGGGLAAGTAQLTRAGRASKIGARAARIVRIIRLVRLIRIVKIYKAAQQTIEQNQKADVDGDDLKIKPGISINLDRRQSDATRIQLSDKKNSNGKLKNTENGDSPQKKRNSLYKSVLDSARDKKIDPDDSQYIKEKMNFPSDGFGQNASEEEEIQQETIVGKQLSDRTIKWVILIVMSVLISIPVFSLDTYVNEYNSREVGLKLIDAFNNSGDYDGYMREVRYYINQHSSDRVNLIGLYYKYDELYSPDPFLESNLRSSEKLYYNIASPNDTSDDSIGFSVFDQRAITNLNSILGIVRTIFVTIILGVGALLFSKDANDLVLFPLEKMLTKVRRIANNPLEAVQIEEREAIELEEIKKSKKHFLGLKTTNKKFETDILEKTILKLGSLLAVGFGEAGSEIIAKNMSNSGEINPMIPGKKIMAIFGFCDIRNFTDATEVLQEGVMIFVNEIAEIVHGTINQFSGAANKNIGDAFLLVWKLPSKEVKQNDGQLEIEHSLLVEQVADMSIISFLKVITSVHKSRKLEKYSQNPDLNERLPNYSVKMGFGLHVGWAIEGAIGSEYKIDASYLSPNVNMASRLEAATKQYGVPILISGALVNIASEEMKNELRLIDRVTVKGSIQPVDFYTCDIDYKKLKKSKQEQDFWSLNPNEKRRIRVNSRKKREDLRNEVLEGKKRVSELLRSDKDLLFSRETYTKEFYELFSKGMDLYLEGSWQNAYHIFSETLNLIPDHRDGPSATLMAVIESEGGKAPHDWKGYRALTEK